tara:strand:- start:2484 stop:2654 length:171 start_codon:yes stop_codon:yes gene_type:complete
MYFIGYLANVLILTTKHKDPGIKTEMKTDKVLEPEPNKNDSILIPEAIAPWDKIWD